jgi:DNA-directed RNA polymerase specialized sigma24 family protein/CheY-like chemotaxis protein
MSNPHALGDALPRLRRYARLLAGSQSSGDRYVEATLETALQDRLGQGFEKAPRVELFRVFSRIWNSVAHISDTVRRIHPTPVDRQLQKVGSYPRQAFLLLFVEQFSEEDAAYALGVDDASLRRWINDFGRELAAGIATDILIIEDDSIVALDLACQVEEMGHRVIGVARNRWEAVTIAHLNRPKLILADIQLEDGSSGVDAVNDLLSSFDSAVIFVTAFPERFLPDERPEGAYLVAKPYRPAAISAGVSQALFFNQTAIHKRRQSRLMH